MTAHANTLKYFRFARELTPGSAAASTGIPSDAGLTLVTVPVDAASVARVGGLTLLEDGTVRTGFAPRPGVPDSAWSVSASRYLDRGPGDVTVSWQVRGFGTGSTNVTSAQDTLLAACLNTVLHLLPPGSASVTVTGAGANAGEAEVSGALEPGELVMAVVNGRAIVNLVTDYDSPTATFLLRWPTALPTSTVIYRGTTLSAPSGANVGTVGDSLYIEFGARSGKTVAALCRLRTLTLTLDGGRLMAEATLAAGYLAQDNSSLPQTVPAPEMPGASYVQTVHLACPQYGTAVTPTTPPASVTSADLTMLSEGFSVTIEAELTPVSAGAGCTLVGMADMQVTALTCRVSLDANDISETIGNDFRTGAQRAWSFPFGPLLAGNGFGVVLPAAHFEEDPAVLAIDGPLAVQPYRLVAGPFAGITDDGDPQDNADFYLFMVG